MYEANNDLNGLLLRDVRWKVKTAGPSPCNNERTEIFLLGCQKAMSGDPCKGCFNTSTWDSSKAEISHDPIKMAKHIAENAPNKYITIGGGEPTDQMEKLTLLCRELKKHGFHVLLYTWRELKEILTQPYWIAFSMGSVPTDKPIEYGLLYLMQYVDVVIDGQYKEEERLWDGTKEDGLISSIGSGNQVVWDIRKRLGFPMKYIDSISLDENELVYTLNTPKINPYRFGCKEV